MNPLKRMVPVMLLLVLLFAFMTVASWSQRVQAQRLQLSTDSEEAKEAFLEGLYHRQNTDRLKAQAAFGRAVDLDPGFTLARLMYVNSDSNAPGAERIARMDEIIPGLVHASTGALLYALARRAWITDVNEANRLFVTLEELVPDDPFVAHEAANTQNVLIYCEGLDTRMRLSGAPVHRDRMDLAVTTLYGYADLVSWLGSIGFSVVWHQDVDGVAMLLLKAL